MEPRRVHSSYVWLGGIGSAFACLITLFFVTFGIIMECLTDVAGDGIGPEALVLILLTTLVIVASIAISFVVRYLQWQRLTYACLPLCLEVRSGVIFKKVVQIPYERIQGIDQRMGLAQRLLGLCNLQIDTAAGSENESAVLPYLTKAEAAALREDLFARKAIRLGAVQAASPVTPATWTPYPATIGETVLDPKRQVHAQQGGNVLDEVGNVASRFTGVFSGQSFAPQASFERTLTNTELLLAAISGTGSTIAAGLGAFVGMVGAGYSFLGAIDSTLDQTTEGLAHTIAESLASTMAGELLFWSVAGLLSVAVVIWVGAVASSLLGYGGFAVRRVGSRVEMERGLVTHVHRGIDVNRIQFIEVRQGLIRRLMGYCEVNAGKIEGTNDGESGNGASFDTGTVVLHPFLKVSEADAFVATLVPEFPTSHSETIAPAPVGLRREMVRGLTYQNGFFWALVTLWGFMGLLWALFGLDDPAFALGFDEARPYLLALSLALAILALTAIPKAILWHRESSVGFGDESVTFCVSGYGKTTTTIPRRKVQSFAVRQNPLQRGCLVSDARVMTAAGGGKQIALRDLSTDDALRWYGWMRPRS